MIIHINVASISPKMGTWTQALDWLCRAGAPLPTSGSLLDMAAKLQDGLILCDIANRIVSGCVPHVHRNAALQVISRNLSL